MQGSSQNPVPKCSVCGITYSHSTTNMTLCEHLRVNDGDLAELTGYESDTDALIKNERIVSQEVGPTASGEKAEGHAGPSLSDIHESDASSSKVLSITDVRGWSLDQVIAYICQNCPEEQLDSESLEILKNNRIKGIAFLNLTFDKLLAIKMSLGPAEVICDCIRDLRRTLKLLPDSAESQAPYFPVPFRTPTKRQLEHNLESSKRPKLLSFPVDCISDFKMLREAGYFYADKTKYIKEIEGTRKVLLFLRPKRFGKSLLISTLKYFYDINEMNNFDSLFHSLDIYEHASELMHNQFLILQWDFSKIYRSSDMKILNKYLEDYINQSIQYFYKKYAWVLKRSSEDLEKLIKVQNCLESIEHLIQCVSTCKYKIYLLIDEYDAFTNEFLDAADTLVYKQFRDKQNLMKAIFAVVKDYSSMEISRVFITGVTPLSMNDITSGFNIRHDITLLPQFEEMCGLRNEDIKCGLDIIFGGKSGMTEEQKERDVIYHFGVMQKYYNGYNYGTKGHGIYNTNLCLDYLQCLLEGQPTQLANVNNELNESVLSFIGKHSDSSSLLIELVHNNKTPFQQIDQNIRIADLANIDNQSVEFLKSFLFYFGALTFADSGYLQIPNVAVNKTIINRVQVLCAISTGSIGFKVAIEDLIQRDNVKPLCLYLESKLPNWIKRGNLSDDRELVIKVMFQISLSMIPHYLNATEVLVPVIRGFVHFTGSGYLDLLLVEYKPVSIGIKRKRFVFEFKSKGIRYLELVGGNRWEDMDIKANCISAMTTEQLWQVKCGGEDKTSNRGMTMKAIYQAATEQLRKYVQGLNADDKNQEFDTTAFVVMSVGSRRFLYGKV